MKYIYMLALLISSFTAHGTLIGSDITVFTSDSPSYSRSFTVSSFYDGDAFVELEIKGDFSNPVGEYFRFFIDGFNIADWSAQSSGLSVVNNDPNLDHQITGTVTISDSLWATFIADGVLNISWESGFGVNYTPIGGEDFVSYNIFASNTSAVSVPSPSVHALLIVFLFASVLSKKIGSFREH